MNLNRNPIPRIFLSLALAGMLTSMTPLWSSFGHPRPTGIEPMLALIEHRRPEILLLGNSLLKRGIDEEFLEELSGKPVLKIYREGSASAWWYLVLKNIIAKSRHKPAMVYLFFRDHYLTEPTFRTTGSFRMNLDLIREADEPVLDRLAKLAGADPLKAFLYRNWPFLRLRHQYRLGLERRMKTLLDLALGRPPGTVDRAAKSAFTPEHLDQRLYTQRQMEAETLRTRRSLDFDASLPRSFLPEMIRIARTHGFQITFVRLRRLRDARRQPWPDGLDTYMAGLRAYLRSKGVPLIDFTHETRLTVDLFADGDHLSPHGQRVFTEVFFREIRKHSSALQFSRRMPAESPTVNRWPLYRPGFRSTGSHVPETLPERPRQTPARAARLTKQK